jgi:acyl-CoA thioester hydrolase
MRWNPAFNSLVSCGAEGKQMDPVFRMELVVPAEAEDANHHVTNLAYLGWMVDAAVEHSYSTGCTRLTKAAGATWVVRTHRIEYFSPAFAGDALVVLTWVADFRKVRSLRRYKIVRKSDDTLLAEGETDWVFVNAATNRPRAIPQEIAAVFGLKPDSGPA